MKKIYTGYYLQTVIICCFAMVSCNNKSSKIISNFKQKLELSIKTIENMQQAYKGKKTATAKYEAFSKKVEDAGVFVPLITPEFKVKNTKENLKYDINGEAYEAKKMYPVFFKTTEIDNNQIAYLSHNDAMKTDSKHKRFSEQVLSDVNENTLNSLPSKYFDCPYCGNTYANTIPKHSDYSLTERLKFIILQ